MESAHAPTRTFTNPPPTPPNQQQASMPVDHVRQVFAMSHVCRAAREGVRGVGGLPAMRISGAREDLLEHMRRVWPRLRFAIDMNGCNVEQFWAVELPKHHACVVEVRADLLYPLFLQCPRHHKMHACGTQIHFSWGLRRRCRCPMWEQAQLAQWRWEPT